MKTKTDQLTNNQKVKNNRKYKQWETYIYIYIQCDIKIVI